MSEHIEQTFDDCELDAHELWFKQLQELPPDHPIRRRVEEGAAAAHAAMPSVRLPLPHNREEADVTKEDSALAEALVDCVGKTLKSVTVTRTDDEHGSHPEITLGFTDGHKIVLSSMDDYEKVSWITARPA